MTEITKKNSLTAWLSDSNNKILLLIVILAFIIRLYYLISSSGQAMWWDEAEYMSASKHWALGVPYDLNEQRPPIFQLLGALLIKLGFGEVALKFFLSLIPSIALVVSSYYLGKELNGPTTGIIAAIGTAFVWSLLFWSVRFQPDFFSVTFQVISLIFFWKLTKYGERKNAMYAGFFASLGFYFKISALLVPISMGLFALYKDGWKASKQKNYWILIGTFVLSMLPFMIWQAINFGSPLAFGVTYSGDFNEGRSLGWMTLDFYKLFTKPLLFALFLIGLVITLVKTLMAADIIIKNKSERQDPYIFSLIILLVITLFYIFYIKGTIEDRWIFLMIPFIFILAARPVLIIYNKIEKYSKFILIILFSILILSFLIPQIKHSTDLINSKKESYAPVKEVSILIKEISQPSDKILSISYTQTTAYAEREVITYSNLPIENFTKILEENRPRFLIVSILEPHHPRWMIEQIRNEQGYTGIIMAYLNSSIIISPQGQLVNYDLKDKIIKDNLLLTRIYPTTNAFGGLVAYKIDYSN